MANLSEKLYYFSEVSYVLVNKDYIIIFNYRLKLHWFYLTIVLLHHKFLMDVPSARRIAVVIFKFERDLTSSD